MSHLPKIDQLPCNQEQDTRHGRFGQIVPVSCWWLVPWCLASSPFRPAVPGAADDSGRGGFEFERCGPGDAPRINPLFLYADQEALFRADGYAAASLDILQKNAALDAIMRDAELSATVQALHNYRTLLWNSQAASTSRQGQLHDQIRTLGHRIYLFVDTIAKQERRMLETAVQESQWFLLISLRIIGLAKYFVGRQLKRVAVAPLKQLEMRLMSIAKGHSNHLGAPSPDREFMAFTDAFNRMLRELEIRRKRMLQSEKLTSLGILTSGVAHELNNPLSNISSSCQLRRTAGGVVGQ